MASEPAFSHLVVVGASAGGIEALAAFVSGLPADFPAPIVIAQHLEPSRESHLAQILARRTSLQVVSVEEAQQLAPGVIYVVPSNHHVRIGDAHVEVHIGHTGGPKPSVDLLLSSAAQVFGDRLIAVILSGTGSDGAAGARVVKKAGGTVIIQDPETAAYPGMPLSLAPTTVDIVASVERLGRILADLLAGASVPTRPEERKALESFLDEVRAHTGINFNSYKMPTILRRLRRRIVATDTKTLTDYIAYIHQHPEEYQQLLNTFLIKVTEFFRDPDLFDFLRETIVPRLVQEARKRGNELRIWSGGCATGEEAYSLAIVISEVLGSAIDHFNIRIFATDADADAIAYARRGVYPATELSNLPEDLVERYFTREDGGYQVRRRIRALTVFGQHDLGGRAPFPRIDLVLCRNVLIYFTPELQQRTLKLFAYALRDGGYLALGKAETPGQLGDFFVPVDKVQKVYRRQGDRILIPPAAPHGMLPAQTHRISLPLRPSHDLSIAQRSQRLIRASTDPFLIQLPVGLASVDHRYDIQRINGTARRLLGIHGAAVGEDLIHLSHGPDHVRLREAIDQVIRTNNTVSLPEVKVNIVPSNEERYLRISCQPPIAEGESAPIQTETVLIVIQDVTEDAIAREQANAQVAELQEMLARLRAQVATRESEQEVLIASLTETNRQLIEADRELTSANEELRAANEELLLSAEEAQAAIEEVETLNEELQATNEELETLNEELQATIEELNTTNEDMNARTTELQSMAHTSERERAVVSAILRSISDAVLVVNSAGQSVMTNAAYERMFGSASATFQAVDAEGKPLPMKATPQARAASGESFRMEFCCVGPNGQRHWYEATGEPMRGGEIADGGVLVIRDVIGRSQEHSAK